MNFDKAVESAIKEAMARGEFDNLAGQGKPIDLTEYFSTPEDVRVAQSLLKNAGLVPAEVEHLQQIAVLKEQLSATTDETVKRKIRKEIEEKQLSLNLLMERHKQQARK